MVRCVGSREVVVACVAEVAGLCVVCVLLMWQGCVWYVLLMWQDCGVSC